MDQILNLLTSDLKTTGLYLCIGAIVAKDIGKFAASKLQNIPNIEHKLDLMESRMNLRLDFQDEKLAFIKDHLEKRLDNLK